MTASPPDPLRDLMNRRWNWKHRPIETAGKEIRALCDKVRAAHRTAQHTLISNAWAAYCNLVFELAEVHSKMLGAMLDEQNRLIDEVEAREEDLEIILDVLFDARHDEVVAEIIDAVERSIGYESVERVS